MSASPPVTQKMQQPVWIAGPPRSGTTLLGKLLASGRGIEYAFEPPFLETLAACVQQGWISDDAAAFLLGDFLDRDLLVEQVLGRRQNFREQDDSHFHFNLTEDELRRRMSALSGTADARAFLQDSKLRLVVKSPQSLSFASAFSRISEKGVFLVPYRRPEPTIASMLQRQWFESRPLEGAAFRTYRAQDGQIFPPPILSPGCCHDWREATAEEKAATLWLSEWSQLLDAAAQTTGLRFVIVDYERLCEAPDTAATQLLQALGIQRTPRTQRWASSVDSRKPRELVNLSVRPEILGTLLQLAEHIEGLLGDSLLATID